MHRVSQIIDVTLTVADSTQDLFPRKILDKIHKNRLVVYISKDKYAVNPNREVC